MPREITVEEEQPLEIRFFQAYRRIVTGRRLTGLAFLLVIAFSVTHGGVAQIVIGAFLLTLAAYLVRDLDEAWGRRENDDGKFHLGAFTVAFLLGSAFVAGSPVFLPNDGAVAIVYTAHGERGPFRGVLFEEPWSEMHEVIPSDDRRDMIEGLDVDGEKYSVRLYSGWYIPDAEIGNFLRKVPSGVTSESVGTVLAAAARSVLGSVKKSEMFAKRVELAQQISQRSRGSLYTEIVIPYIGLGFPVPGEETFREKDEVILDCVSPKVIDSLGTLHDVKICFGATIAPLPSPEAASGEANTSKAKEKPNPLKKEEVQTRISGVAEGFFGRAPFATFFGDRATTERQLRERIEKIEERKMFIEWLGIIPVEDLSAPANSGSSHAEQSLPTSGVVPESQDPARSAP